MTRFGRVAQIWRLNLMEGDLNVGHPALVAQVPADKFNCLVSSIPFSDLGPVRKTEDLHLSLPEPLHSDVIHRPNSRAVSRSCGPFSKTPSGASHLRSCQQNAHCEQSRVTRGGRAGWDQRAFVLPRRRRTCREVRLGACGGGMERLLLRAGCEEQ